jgi:outer membrane protein assembly factor BamB
VQRILLPLGFLLAATWLVWAARAVPAADETATTNTLGWRGDGSGRYPQADPPSQWDSDSGRNILWRAKVGKGQSTPLAVGRCVLVASEPDRLTALDAADGKVLWTRASGYQSLPPGIKTPEKNPPTSPNCGYSTPTPTSDGQAVYAAFGTGVVACYDLAGARRWLRYLDMRQTTEYGRSASPLLVGGKLIVSLGGLVALEAQSGRTLWQTPEAKMTYGTPATATIGESEVLFTPGGDCVRLADGKILARRLAASTYTSPLVDSGVVYYLDSSSVAIKLPAQATEGFKPEKLWDSDDLEGEFYTSPLLSGGILYTSSNAGVLYALEAKTGKIIWQKELEIRNASGKPGSPPGNLYPSPTLAGNRLLVGNDVGQMLVLVPGAEYRETARNFLEQGSGASPVPDGKRLFLRGGDKLYAIGRK